MAGIRIITASPCPLGVGLQLNEQMLFWTRIDAGKGTTKSKPCNTVSRDQLNEMRSLHRPDMEDVGRVRRGAGAEALNKQPSMEDAEHLSHFRVNDA